MCVYLFIYFKLLDFSLFDVFVFFFYKLPNLVHSVSSLKQGKESETDCIREWRLIYKQEPG